MCVLLSDVVFKYILFRKTDVLKLVGKVNILERKFEEMH